ncbi:16204_t:CDS:2 [Gigaspora rosea]|nr:16204_t:CDS:2 [Gigaspora rosea]
MTLREINSIQFRKDHKCKFDTASKHKKIEPIVVRKIIGYVLIFVIQWTPSMIYVFCQTIGYDEMWIYLVTEATINLGGIGNMIQYIINEGWRNDPDANINDSGDISAVIIPTPSSPDTNYPNYQISSSAPTITLPFHQSKIRVNEMITIKIDDYKSNNFIPNTFGDSPTIAPSIDSKVESLKNQRKDEMIMKQQREIVQRDISVSSSSSQSDHSNIMNELDKIIERHNEDVIRHGGIMARQSDNMSRQSGTTTTLTREKSLKSYRKSIKNKNNRNDTVSWHRFGGGGNSRTSIRSFLQKVDKFKKVKDPKNIDEIKEIDENLPHLPPDDTCIMHGLPEESDGCKLKGKVLLTSSKGLKIKSFNFAFIGKTNVTCCPFISSTRPELCRRECSFPAPPRIPPGIHEFKFEVDLPGHLPSSFKGTRGKIEYWCYVVIERPLFHADISIKKPVTIQRSLIPNDILTSPITLQDRLTTFTDGILDEKVQYNINAPIMAYREGGLVSIQLSLKPLNSDIIIKSVEYGLKELVHYHKSSSHDDDYSLNNSIKEDRFPLGKKTITFNNVNNILNIMSLGKFDYHRRLSFSDAPSQIIHNSNSNFLRFSQSDVNFHQHRSMPGSFINNQILNSIPNNCADSIHHNSITKKTFTHKEQLSLEIPLIITTKSRYNSYSDRTSMRSSIRNSTHMDYNLGNNNLQDNERSPPYTMVEDPPAYMYAALVPPPPRYNQEF